MRAQTFDAGRRDTLEYGAAGNLHAMQTKEAGDPAQYNERVSYYGVDGRLAAADARNVAFGSTALAGHVAFEEYRYDALGRRVLARVRRWCDDDTGTSEGGDGTPCEIAAIRRTVWNGASELAEIQMPADDSTPPDTVENDTLAVQRHWEQMSAHPLYDANRLYGRVLYVPGLVTDEPVFITRVNYADASDNGGGAQTYAVYAPFSIVPLWNAQGRVDRAVLGGTAAPGADALCVGATTRCAEIAFDRGIYPYARSGSDPGSWQGTLLVDKPDATGTYYRRNRSYDPSLGRFTQEDPIGLGGGLNLYGFANGDPVNASDPFGLSGCKKDLTGDEKKECEEKEKKTDERKNARERENRRDKYNACIDDTPGSYAMAALSAVPLGNMKLGQGFRQPGSSAFTSIDRRAPWLPFANPEGGVVVRTVGSGAVKTAGTLGTIGAAVGAFATAYSLTTIARCALESRNP